MGTAIEDLKCSKEKTSTGNVWMKVAFAVWLVILAAGLVGLLQRFLYGHLPAGYGSYVPWGLWVALYFHGVGIAGGAFLIGSLGYILNWPDFRRPVVLRAVIVLSAAAILPSFVGVWLDLGHLDRATLIFTSPSFSSMMAFNAWMYGVFLMVALLAWLLSFKKESEWLKPLLCLGALFSIVFPSQSGAFFGVVDAKPYWHSALLPMLFLTSAIIAGTATLLLVRYLLRILRPEDEAAGPAGESDFTLAIRRLRAVVLVSLIVYFVFEFAEFSIAFWNPASEAPEFRLILFGPYWWVFWIIHIGIGGLVPLLLLIAKRSVYWAFGALLLSVAFVSARLNILIPGQAVGELHGLHQAFQHPRLTYVYHATPMEYFVGAFMVAMGIAIFYIGLRIGGIVEHKLKIEEKVVYEEER